MGVDGEAHGKLYVALAEGKEQGPWQQTFVKGVGYKKFPVAAWTWAIWPLSIILSFRNWIMYQLSVNYMVFGGTWRVEIVLLVYLHLKRHKSYESLAPWTKSTNCNLTCSKAPHCGDWNLCGINGRLHSSKSPLSLCCLSSYKRWGGPAVQCQQLAVAGITDDESGTRRQQPAACKIRWVKMQY